MVITSAVKHKTNSEMIQIYIDNAYAFSMPEEEYLKMNLYERKEISAEEINNIREEVNVKLAKQRGIRLLTTRDRSEFEIVERLLKQGFDRDAAEKAVEHLKVIGYVNDRLFAHKYLSDRLKLKPMSKKSLQYELHKRGIAAEIIETVLDEFELDESQIAYRIAKKKFGKYEARDPKIQRKIASFLMFRGFSGSIIKTILEQMQE